MLITIRNITFKLYRADGSTQEIQKELWGDNAEVQWVAEQFAEVNECGVTAEYLGEQIAIAGNIQN